MCIYVRVFLWRQMAPQQSAKFRIAFWSFFPTLRKDSVANYAWIWTLFSPYDRLHNAVCALQRTKRFVVPSVGSATRFANLRQKFSKTPKNRPQSCAKYFTIEIVINSIRLMGQYPAGMHCPSWDDAFVSSCAFIYSFHFLYLLPR